MNSGVKFGALCALMLGLMSCQSEQKPMTEQEAQRVKQFTAQMSPRCVGRYIVDVPKAFVLNEESAAQVDGVTITIEPRSKGQFEIEFEARTKYLQTRMLPGRDKNRPHLKTTHQLPGGALGSVFDRSESEASTSRLGRTLELLAWRDGFAIKAEIKATDISFPEDATDPGQLRTNVEAKLATLLGVYSRLRGRSQDELPSQPGLCIVNGFVAGPATDTEAVQTAFHLEGTPDVYFNLFTQTEVKESTTMLERSGGIESKMAGAGIKTVRKGWRRIHEHAYEEWLVRGPTVDRVPGHEFTLHGNEKDGGADKPMLDLSLYNGYRIPAAERTPEQSAQLVDLTKASLSEAEAVGIWDAVTATVRPWQAGR